MDATYCRGAGPKWQKRKKKAKAKKKKLSPEEKLQRRIQQKLYRDFRTCMSELGFSQIRADGTEIVVDGRTGELDDIFVHEKRAPSC